MSLTAAEKMVSSSGGPARDAEADLAQRVARRQKDADAWNDMVARVKPDHIYYIDIVGSCNLACPACAVGNSAARFAKKAMSLETYEAILQKIRREHADERIDIELYIWGEPVLHPKLPQIIRLTKSYEMSIGLSCNMNLFPNMREVVKAGPTFIRISLSGYTNDVYRQAHKGGDINAVKANMHLLRHYLDETGSSTLPQVFYHVYTHNMGAEFDAMRRLSAELDFLFDGYVASLRPVEKTIDAINGIVSPADQAIVDRLAVPMTEASRIAMAHRDRFPDCHFRSGDTFINTDGSVRICGVSIDPKHHVAESFLETPREELRRRKYAHGLCRDCLACGADMILSGAAQPQIHERAVETLGPQWAAYVAGG